jgi:RNA polymerase sigma-70 factor (ECF subfamily)
VGTLNLSAAEQETLAAALRRGDPGAFEELYAALHSSIYRFAARLLDDPEEAKDVTQDVFLAAYRDLPQQRGALRVEPWLFRVAMNACYDRLRARARRADMPLDEVAPLVDARDGYDQSAMASAVEAALRDMSPRYRAALILHDVQGLNRRELSEAMGVTWGTAGVLLFRARTAFKKRLTALLPAGGGVAGLALLPALPVPSALQAPPLFGAPAAAAPLAAPLCAAPAAMPAAAPLLGLANIGGVLGTKIALVAAGCLALASGLAVQEVVDQSSPILSGRSVAEAVQPATTRSAGDDAKSLRSQWPGHLPLHSQGLGAAATAGDPSSGSAGAATGSTVRVKDATAVAGDDAGGTSTQQAGTVEPPDPTAGDTTPADADPTDADGTAASGLKTSAPVEPSVRN